ncbi:MAG: hypothetical protein PUB13_07875, partial [Lachnospiraceae bacterium]|nr:hypothetical protein [Lachnospiraceae bacterium]
NDLFFLLLFFAVCLSIYIRAYQKGVYITADSAGYLREAVNLVNGNGFAYDGMAGYRSWFANWPIIYPAMIAMVMVITKANAYLASKIVAMLIVAGILILMRIVFKEDAWVYALCLTNIGFLNLTYYTWSEIPFMLFLAAYTLVLAKTLNEKEPKIKWYVLLSILGLCCFLTRYFGIYVFIVTGLYILCMAIQYCKKKDGLLIKKAVSLTISSFLSGICCLAYLMMNKIMNGKASGVSRTLWWDDYEKLTNDLIESLLTEFFNIFSLQIPDLIEGFPYEMKVFVLGVIIMGAAVFVGRHAKFFGRESVMITMGILYYLIFIAIRYVSSMDTFYFRFFEPATFLICIGLIGLLLPYLKGKKAFCFFGGGVTAMILIAVISLCMNAGVKTTGGYYEQLTAQWEEQYEEIPEKSVIIFNDIDFRSSYYRPDVMEGMITPQDTFENIRETYYGSDYLCIRREFAQSMLESGEYEQSIVKHLQEGMDTQDSQKEFLVISLK